MEGSKNSGAEEGNEEDSTGLAPTSPTPEPGLAPDTQNNELLEKHTANVSLVPRDNAAALSDYSPSTAGATEAMSTNPAHSPLLPSSFENTPYPQFPTYLVPHGLDPAFAQSFVPPPPDEHESNDASHADEIEAFAKLEFSDGDFFMKTHALDLGRDLRLAYAPHLQESPQQQNHNIIRSRKRSRSGNRHALQSRGAFVSETSGIIRPDLFEDDDDEATDRRRRSSRSTTSSSQSLHHKRPSRRRRVNYDNGASENENWVEQHSEEKLSSVSDAHSRDQLPPADKIPLIPIHSASSTTRGEVGPKSRCISRRHARIFFNPHLGVFQICFFGKNGGFVDEHWYGIHDIVTLVSGSVIQLKDVCIKFTLPNVPDGETGAEEAEFLEDSSPMIDAKTSFGTTDSDRFDDLEGFDFENANRVVQYGGDDESEQDLPPTRGRLISKAKPEPEPEIQRPKRRGPGRPPKNGVMSKREQAQQAREARENAKAKTNGKSNPTQRRGKDKPAKAVELKARHLQPNGKRKYTKRKKPTEIEDAQRGCDSTEQDESVSPETAFRPGKDKRPIKPPRSPSPVFNEADLTAEQLAKPQSSYVVLLHEALSNSKTGQMSLPQIYRAIERRYPFFKLRVQTQGWQSSVRHNLSQHPAFAKIQRDGKGWMWGLVPSVSIEKEKKRRVTPPAAPQQNYQYLPQSQRYPSHTNPYPYPNIPAPGHNPMPFPYPVSPMPFPPRLGPNGIPLPFVQPQAESTYKSPYESNPDTTQEAPTAMAQTNAEENGVDKHYPTPTSQPPPHQQQQAQIVTQSPSPLPNGFQINTPRYRGDLLAKINGFKAALVDSLDQVPDAEKLVSSVINHKLYNSSLRAEAGSDERAILLALDTIILADLGNDRNLDSAAQDGSADCQAEVTPAQGGETVAAKAADVARKIQDEKKTAQEVEGRA